eukprot:495979-Hanusia_phi.AAC.1
MVAEGRGKGTKAKQNKAEEGRGQAEKTTGSHRKCAVASLKENGSRKEKRIKNESTKSEVELEDEKEGISNDEQDVESSDNDDGHVD